VRSRYRVAGLPGFLLIASALLLCVAAAKQESLPQLGTKFHELPKGDGRAQVDAACLPCHSADILVQQRLNEKQWTASVEKMVRWGAIVPDADKATMVLYLSKNFGPESKFTPIKVRSAR
jgi:hypothetical protein